MGQTFTYSGYIYNAGGGGAQNVPVKLYKRTTPTLAGFTSQNNYNGHSYYRSTGSAYRDWETLREEIKKYGMRHSTLTACMPVESSSVIQSSTNGIEPPLVS